MKAITVKRDFWTFGELAQRYGFHGADALDMRRLVIDGTLPLVMWVRAALQPVVEVDGALVPDDCEPVQLNGYAYVLRKYARQFDSFNYELGIVSDAAPDAYGDVPANARLYALAEPVPLDALLKFFGLVSDKDRQAAELAMKADPSTSLTKREEGIRDQMIATLFLECHGWVGEGAECHGLTELEKAMEACGFPVSRNALRKHLRLAWERATPRLAPTGDEAPRERAAVPATDNTAESVAGVN